MKQLDLFVIGAGTGGYTAAIRAAREGLSVGLAEERDIGGACLNRGCIPTKALMHSALAYRQLSDAESLGIKAQGVSFDFRRMMGRKDEVVAQIRGGIEQLIRANKIELFNGRAVISGQSTVTVCGEAVKAKNIIIATGARPAKPPIPGIDLPGVITSDELLSWEGEAFSSLTVIGGGVIGMEFATVFNALGCEVTVIEAAERILPNMDREISQNLGMILKKRGVAIHTASAVEKIEPSGEGLCVTFSSKGKTIEAVSEKVLVAAGRKPVFDGTFEAGTLSRDERGIIVDENFQTSLPGVYAIGDVVSGGIQLAHAASAQALNVAAHILGNAPETDISAIPSCVYTDPEIACVGLTEAQARERGMSVKIGKYPMSGNGKSIIEGQERGFIKLVFDAESDVLLGAQLMCARATDLISELTGAVVNRLGLSALSRVVRPHPTFTEGVTEAVGSAEGKAVHLAPKKRL